MLFTIVRMMEEWKKEALVKDHAKGPWNNMSNKEYEDYLGQDFVSCTLFSTDDEEKGIQECLERETFNGYIHTKIVEVDYLGNIKRILRILN